jgi:hypothetical protein
MPKDEVFGGLTFKFHHEDSWRTYWRRGVLGMVLQSNGEYQCYTLEGDLERNPCYSWVGKDPHELVERARAFHREYCKKWDDTLLPDQGQ